MTGESNVKIPQNVLKNAALSFDPAEKPARKDKRSRGSGHTIHTFFSRARSNKNSSVPDSAWENQALLCMGFSFAAGIVVYTLLSAEPSWQLLTIVLLCLTGFAILENRKKGLRPLALLALAFWAGGTLSFDPHGLCRDAASCT